jgi:hypothetical protein
MSASSNSPNEARDLVPFPLVTDTSYAADGWRVDLVVLLDITADGYESFTVAQYDQPYTQVGPGGPPDTSPEAAEAVRRAAITHFAEKLRRALDSP